MVWRNSIVSPEGFRYFLLVFNSLQDTGSIVFPSWFDSSKMGYVVLVKLDGGYMIVGVDGPDTTEDWVPEIGYAFKDVHTVTFSCTHGSVGATIDGVAIVSPCIVPAGKSVVFTITPDEGYEYTGTNPETVLVNADVTKAYECTAVPTGPDLNLDEYVPVPAPTGEGSEATFELEEQDYLPSSKFTQNSLNVKFINIVDDNGNCIEPGEYTFDLDEVTENEAAWITAGYVPYTIDDGVYNANITFTVHLDTGVQDMYIYIASPAQ